MTAFVAFVQTYAIWLYLLCALGILIGFKILADARRLARTTLFSLEQERAGERTYRAILLIIVLLLAMGAVTTVNVLIAPAVPQQESPILRGPTATLAAVVFPSSTPPPSVTPTLIKPTETPFLTSTPVTATATRAAVRPTVVAVPVTPTPPFVVPAPLLISPPNKMVVTGEGNKNTSLTFKWVWTCPQCALGPNDKFVVNISFTDRSGKPVNIAPGTQQDFLTMGSIMVGSGIEIYQQAKEDTFYWNIQVKRGDQPLSPPSEMRQFVWH